MTDVKSAIERAVADGAIPTDEPIYCTYVDHKCPECNRKTRGIEQAACWSHIGKATTKPSRMECWYCGNQNLVVSVWSTEWDAPLEQLPVSAVPEEYLHPE